MGATVEDWWYQKYRIDPVLLQQRMRDLGYSAETLGLKVGLTKSTVYRVLETEGSMHLETAFRIADGLGMTVDELRYEDPQFDSERYLAERKEKENDFKWKNGIL